jgi:integrase
VDLVFKKLLKQPAATVTASDLQIEADSYPSKQSAAFAVRCIRPALKWAAAPSRRRVSAELAMISTPATVARRKRVLTEQELAAVLPMLRASGRPYAAALRFMLLTLCRRQEAASARWRDVDFTASTWTIPDTKNNEPHVVPLSRQAIELLNAIKLVTVKPDAPIFTTTKGAPLGRWDHETRLIHQASGTNGWHRHDLRRTGATTLGKMGELPHVIEAALNHASIHSPLAGNYNTSRYLPQVAIALQRLADRLDEIEAGAAQADASEIRAGAVSPA